MSLMRAARGIQVIMFADCDWKHTHRYYYSLCRFTEGLLPPPGGLLFCLSAGFLKVLQDIWLAYQPLQVELCGAETILPYIVHATDLVHNTLKCIIVHSVIPTNYLP